MSFIEDSVLTHSNPEYVLLTPYFDIRVCKWIRTQYFQDLTNFILILWLEFFYKYLVLLVNNDLVFCHYKVSNVT